MRKCVFFWMVIVILAFQVGPLTQAQADAVGRITQVEGQVDILKGGKLPANPVKLQDAVESGDVLRTKSLSKAQITFIDNSIITLSPESRLAIDEYQFKPEQQQRNAVMNLFQGMAHVVVNKLFKADQPDFVIKTQTAVTGVRGTDFGVRVQPNASTILNFQGVTQVANIFPEVSQLSRRAFKVAFAFGPPGSPGSVWLKDMQGTTVARGLPPTLPFALSLEDRKQFMHQLSYGVTLRKKEQDSGSGGSSAGGGSQLTTSQGWTESALSTAPSTSGSTSSVPLVAPTGLITGTGNVSVTALNTVTVPPTVVPVAEAPQPAPSPNPISTYRFSQTFTGPYQLTSTSPFTVAVFSNTGPGFGTRTGVYAGSFTASFSFNGQWVNPSLVWTSSYAGTFQATMTGQVTGILGQVLTGTMSSIINDPAIGAGQFTMSGPVTILPSGALTSSFTGTGITAAGDQINVTNGNMTQTPIVTQTPGAILAPTTTLQVAAAVSPVISPPITARIVDAVTPKFDRTSNPVR
jgi:hypothetical protein